MRCENDHGWWEEVVVAYILSKTVKKPVIWLPGAFSKYKPHTSLNVPGYRLLWLLTY